jgi:hypothetical protein
MEENYEMSKSPVMFDAQVLVDQPQAGWQHHPEGSFSSNHMPSLDDEDYDDGAEEALLELMSLGRTESLRLPLGMPCRNQLSRS